ncbi:MAG: lipocalin family protein [Gaiellaceae bacterium]
MSVSTSRTLRRPSTALCAVVFACALTQVAHASPYGVPVPGGQPTAEDLTATSTEGGDVQAPVPGAGTCNTVAHQPISLPADDAPHSADASIEWWWWYGHLTTRDGRRLGYLVWFATRPWADVTWADYMVSDLSNHTYHYGREPIIHGLPKSTRNGFDLRAAHASALGGDGRDSLSLNVDGYRLALSLRATRPPTIQLGDGYLSAWCNNSYYYTRDRMRASARLVKGGRTVAATGDGSFSHQWGFMPLMETVQYNYLSFQLADGRSIVVAEMRDDQDPKHFRIDAGSISYPDGRSTQLHHDDFSFTPTRWWQRDATCRYPVEWDVRVKGMHLHARAELDGSEARATGHPEIYATWPEWANVWSGPTVVSGDASGVGWLENSRYCSA